MLYVHLYSRNMCHGVYDACECICVYVYVQISRVDAVSARLYACEYTYVYVCVQIRRTDAVSARVVVVLTAAYSGTRVHSSTSAVGHKRIR
jgi:hypothetical protein